MGRAHQLALVEGPATPGLFELYAHARAGRCAICGGGFETKPVGRRRRICTLPACAAARQRARRVDVRAGRPRMAPRQIGMKL